MALLTRADLEVFIDEDPEVLDAVVTGVTSRALVFVPALEDESALTNAQLEAVKDVLRTAALRFITSDAGTLASATAPGGVSQVIVQTARKSSLTPAEIRDLDRIVNGVPEEENLMAFGFNSLSVPVPTVDDSDISIDNVAGLRDWMVSTTAQLGEYLTEGEAAQVYATLQAFDAAVAQLNEAIANIEPGTGGGGTPGAADGGWRSSFVAGTSYIKGDFVRGDDSGVYGCNVNTTEAPVVIVPPVQTSNPALGNPTNWSRQGAAVASSDISGGAVKLTDGSAGSWGMSVQAQLALQTPLSFSLIGAVSAGPGVSVTTGKVWLGFMHGTTSPLGSAAGFDGAEGFFGICVDFDANQTSFYKNGQLVSTQDGLGVVEYGPGFQLFTLSFEDNSYGTGTYWYVSTGQAGQSTPFSTDTEGPLFDNFASIRTAFAATSDQPIYVPHQNSRVDTTVSTGGTTFSPDWERVF